MKIIEYSYNDPGYLTLMRYQSWRVAFLNYIDELKPENISYFEAHHMTDEVFVLLEGSAILFYLEDGKVMHVKMEKNKVYNVKKDVYHTHALSIDCKLLIVEEENTSEANSSKIYTDEKMRLVLSEIWRGYIEL